MNHRDRLAADLRDVASGATSWATGFWFTAADRLIALGWTRLDFRAPADHAEVDAAAWHAAVCLNPARRKAAVIAKAYREDTDA